MSHKAVVHNENLADQEDGAEEEPRPLSCTANCVVSSLLVAYICSRKCDVQKVASEFAFFPPSPPTYQLRRDEASGEVVGIDYNYSELAEELTSASLGNFKAHGIACEMLEVGVRQTDPPGSHALSQQQHINPHPHPHARPLCSGAAGEMLRLLLAPAGGGGGRTHWSRHCFKALFSAWVGRNIRSR